MSHARLNLIKVVVFCLTLPIAVVLSTHLARRSFEKVRLGGQSVSVKGYAERPIVSDRAEWSTMVVGRDADRTAAYAALAESRDRLLAYLSERGFASDTVAPGPVHIEELYGRDLKGNRTNEIESFVVTQSFAIASMDVDAVTRAAREVGSLIGEGFELQSSSPSYLYTKLDELKLTMLAEATTNARERAELLVAGSDNGLGALRSASQGVFQITPAFSTEVSSSGYNDTSSIDKTIKAVVTVEYAIGD